jgi:hypothetical protein
MTDFKKGYDEMLLALKNEVKYVWFSDHIMDNSFILKTVEETIREIPEEFIPIGFCYKPDYRPEKGVGFQLQERESGIEVWVHVPLTCFERWLESVNLLDELFPNGTYGICGDYGA